MAIIESCMKLKISNSNLGSALSQPIFRFIFFTFQNRYNIIYDFVFGFNSVSMAIYGYSFRNINGGSRLYQLLAMGHTLQHCNVDVVPNSLSE